MRDCHAAEEIGGKRREISHFPATDSKFRHINTIRRKIAVKSQAMSNVVIMDALGGSTCSITYVLSYYLHEFGGSRGNGKSKQKKKTSQLLPLRTPVQSKPSNPPQTLCLSESHALLDLGNGESRVQTLGACPGAVENGVAAVDGHAVVESVLALLRLLVTGVGDPAVRLEKDGGAEVLLAVPPIRGARCAAARAENALVEAVELFSVHLGLTVLASLQTVLVRMGFRWSCGRSYVSWCRVPLKIRLDRLVLLVELGKIGDEILDNVGVR